MRLSTAKEKVKSILSHTDDVPALWGERGIGKTDVLRQVAEELGWGYHAVYPSSLEGPDFMGLTVKDPEAGVTRYLAPEFLPVEATVRAGMFPERGLLVVEELNRAELQTIHALYPLLQNRTINRHRVHEGWKIAVAMNPDTAEYTTVSMDMAALDRIVIVPVEPHVEDYIDYCISTSEYDRDVLDFLSAYPQMLLGTAVEDGSGVTGKSPSPRGWSRVQRLRLRAGIGLREDPGDIEIISGVVGSKAAASLYGYLRDREVQPIPAEVVIKQPEEAIQRLDFILQKGRYDVLNLTLRELVVQLPVNRRQLAGVERFLLRLPEEMQVMTVKLLNQKRRGADFQKILDAWTTMKKKVFSKVLDVVREAL